MSRWAVMFAGLLLTGQDAADPQPVADTKFSYNRGFYDTPFTALIQSKTPGARIRYTLDGSAPTPTRGLGDASPVTVRVESTTTLRAMAYKVGMRPTNVDTHTYIFIEDVLKQPYGVEGFPHPTLRTGFRPHEKVILDYQMDASVVDDPRYRSAIRKGLRSIPTISIVLAREDLFGEVEASDDSGLDMRRSGVYWGGGRQGKNLTRFRGAPLRVDAATRLSGGRRAREPQLVFGQAGAQACPPPVSERVPVG